MQSIVFALVALVGWGTGDVAGAVASRRLGTFATSIWSYAWSLVFFVVFIPFNPIHMADLFGGPGVLSALLGLLLVACYPCFNEALRVGNPSVVGAISGAFLAIVVVLSIVFLHDTLTPIQAVAIVAVMSGVVLTLLGSRSVAGARLDRGIAFALIVMIGWGVYFTFIKIPIKEIGPFWPNYISVLVGFGALLVYSRGRGLRLHRGDIRGQGGAIGAGLLLGGGTLAYNAAVVHGSTAIVAAISGPYPVLFVLLSSLIFKEPIARRQLAGIVLTLIGVVVLSVVSG